jgi:hypothetical protein
VLAVWLPMLATDSRDGWDPTLLDDPRVTHLWDGDRVTGTWFADSKLDLGYPGPVVWDAYLVFGPDARWGDPPSGFAGAGWTVIGRTDDLDAELERVLR